MNKAGEAEKLETAGVAEKLETAGVAKEADLNKAGEAE